MASCSMYKNCMRSRKNWRIIIVCENFEGGSSHSTIQYIILFANLSGLVCQPWKEKENMVFALILDPQFYQLKSVASLHKLMQHDDAFTN